MQSDCADLGQQITIYRLKPVDGEILIEETGTVIYVNVRIWREQVYKNQSVGENRTLEWVYMHVLNLYKWKMK
jgi:hypothetical protein